MTRPWREAMRSPHSSARRGRSPGHESLSTTLRYLSLVSSDLEAAHKRAETIERMRLG